MWRSSRDAGRGACERDRQRRPRSGIVNLSRRAAKGPRRCILSGASGCRSAPVLHRLCSEDFQGFAGAKVALGVEGVVDSSMGRQKALRGPGRFEPLHLPFPSTRRLMGVLRPVVPALSLLVAGRETELPLGGPVGPELVGGDRLGRKAELPDELTHDPEGCPGVPSGLYKDVEHLTFVVHRPPEPMPLALSRELATNRNLLVRRRPLRGRGLRPPVRCFGSELAEGAA